MKFSNFNLRALSTALLAVSFMVVGPVRVTAQTANFGALGSQLNTITEQLRIIQGNNTLQANPAAAAQINSTLSQMTQLQQGVNAINNLVNVQALGGVAGTTGGLNVALESLQEITSLPALQNFPGIAGLSGQLGQISDLSGFANSVQQAISNPNVQSLGVLARALDNGAPLLSGLGLGGTSSITGGLSGIAGLGGLAQDPSQILRNPAQTLQVVTQATNGLSSLFGDPTTQAVLKVPSVPGFQEATKFVSTIAGPAQIGTDFSAAIGAGNSCGASISGVISDRLGGLVSSRISSAIGGGVPTIEQQSGPLFKITNETKNLTNIICKHLDEMRAIQRKLLEVQTELLVNEKQGDPAEYKKTSKNLVQMQNVIKKDSTERKIKDANGKVTVEGSYFPTLSQFVKAETTKAVTGAIDAVKKANKTYLNNSALIAEIEAEREVKKTGRADALIAMALAEKEPVDPNNFWDNFTASLEPQNTYVGRKLIASNLIRMVEEEAAKEAETTWLAGQGVAPRLGRCITQQRLEDGTLYCLQHEVVTPGALVGSRYSAVNNADVDLIVAGGAIEGTGETRDIITTTFLGNIEDPAPQGITLTNIFDIADTICQLAPANKICGTKQKETRPIFADNSSGSAIFSESGADFSGSQADFSGSQADFGDGSDLNGFSGTGGSIVTTPQKPVLNTRTVNNISFEDINTSTISWNSSNTNSCVAGNDWITWGDGSKPTASSTVIVAKGEEVGTGGALDVFHPTLFKLSAQTELNFDDQDGIAPGLQNNIVTRFSTTSQITTYTPNMANVESSDRFEITLNGRTISTRRDLPSITPEALVLELKNLKTNLTTSDSRFTEYNKVTFDGTNTLIVKADSATPIETFANYEINCRGTGGVANKTVTLTF